MFYEKIKVFEGIDVNGYINYHLNALHIFQKLFRCNFYISGKMNFNKVATANLKNQHSYAFKKLGSFLSSEYIKMKFRNKNKFTVEDEKFLVE